MERERSVLDMMDADEFNHGGGKSNTIMVVLYRLPIIAKRKDSGDGWSLEFDNDALYLTSEGLKECLSEKKNLVWIGVLNTNEDLDEREQQEVNKELWERFKCIPVVISKEDRKRFYSGFCKGVLWPVLHMVNYVRQGEEARYDESLWHVYRLVNRMFMETAGDLIWIHDYHLMILPAMLRPKISCARIGFFLHTPWPSSEMYRNIPWRDELLRGMLASSLLGFHLFDYARHFLSSCVRLLDLEQKARRGTLTIDYNGRTVTIRVSHIGIHPERFARSLESPEVIKSYNEMVDTFEVKGKCVFAAIDDLDIIKGISLKLLAFETFLENYPEYSKNVKLVQMAIPRAATVKKTVQKEIVHLVERINSKFGSLENKPVVYFERNITFTERIALYRMTDVLLLLPIRDGLNLVPYEYIISSQGRPPGQMVLSECTGCSRALSLAVRVNPFDRRAVSDALRRATEDFIENTSGTSDEKDDRAARQMVDLKYVTTHSTRTWAESFLEDIEKIAEPTQKWEKRGFGLGVGKQLLHFEGFEHLNTMIINRAYQRSKRRLFLMDYDGTLVSGGTRHGGGVWAQPSEMVTRTLAQLSAKPGDKVCILSGRTKAQLSRMFTSLDKVGLAAEHGFNYRLPGSSEWLNQMEHADTSWMEIAQGIMAAYTERTDGSFIEEKNSGLVWHYKNADREFGTWQAKEMHEHLDSVLNVFDVQVLSGAGWLQVRLAGVSKGNMVKRFISDAYSSTEPPDFIFCAGDDVTDEDMFDIVSSYKEAEIFTCVVGVKPSNARYYLRSSDEVINMLASLAVSRFGTQSHSFNSGSELPVRVPTHKQFRKRRLTLRFSRPLEPEEVFGNS